MTYDTVLKADRRGAHARTAAWLAERVGDREAEYLAITAEHYERAGDQALALDWYERAARAAQDRFANQASLAYLARMLAMPEMTDPRRRWAVLKQQSAVADLLGDRRLQHEALEDSARMAEQVDDDGMRASSAVAQSLLADRLGDRVRALAMAERAADLAERAGVTGIAALAHAELCWLARERGDLALAHHHIDIALPFAKQAAEQMVNWNDHVYEASLRLVAAQLHMSEFDHDRAWSLLQEAQRLAEQRHQRRLSCSSHEALARWALDMLDTGRAADHIDATATIAQEIGAAVILALVPMLRARLALLTGEFEPALTLTQEADVMLARLGARNHQAECLAVRAQALACAGRPAASRQALQQALDLYVAITADNDARACRLLMADTWRQEGAAARSLAGVEAELPFLAEAGSLDAEGLPARVAAWRVLAASGDVRAPRQLELAMSELERFTAKIGDATVRARVLEGLPLHREIMSAWQARIA